MIDIWAPGEMTMSAGYSGNYEDYAREDDSNFYDYMVRWNKCRLVLMLYL